MNNEIIGKVIKKTGNPDILQELCEKLTFSELQSLLLEVYRRRTESLDPKYLFNQYKNNRFTRISPVAPERFIKLEELIYSILPKNYRTVELSPLSPIGSSSIVAPINQNNIISTIRNNEVIADPTNALALEASKIREKSDKSKTVRLCTNVRVTRTQLFKGDDSVAHFKILSLCSAGRDKGSFTFELENLKEQLEFYIFFLKKLPEIDVKVNSIRILIILYNNLYNDKIKQLILDIKKDNAEVEFEIKQFDGKQSYYQNVRYNIFATNCKGEEYFLCDGGFNNWTQQILNNKKERFLSSGFGTERLFLVF